MPTKDIKTMLMVLFILWIAVILLVSPLAILYNYLRTPLVWGFSIGMVLWVITGLSWRGK